MLPFTSIPYLSAAVVRRRLGAVLVLLWGGLTLLFGGVLYMSLQKSSEQAFYQERFAAEQTLGAIDDALATMLREEEKRPFDHYSFFTVIKDELSSSSQVQRSPLSQLPVADDIPGLVGYFQIESDGSVSSPLLPLKYSQDPLTPSERENRVQMVQEIAQVLSTNLESATIDNVAGAAKVSQDSLLQGEWKQRLGGAEKGLAGAYRNSVPTQVAEQRLADKDTSLERQQSRKVAANALSFEKDDLRGAVGQASAIKEKTLKKERERLVPKVATFEAELDPIQIRTLNQENVVLFRKVWHGDKRIIQGVLVKSRPFFEMILRREVERRSFPPSSSVLVSVDQQPIVRLQTSFGSDEAELTHRSYKKGNVAQVKEGVPSKDILIYQDSFATPFQQYSLYISAPSLPLPPGTSLVIGLAIVFELLLVVGTLVLYRLVCAQIEYAEQRSDFVSAVSHELKTPLTSIRMYGEMLRNGWVADEAKRKSYYDFIFHESERLSRLISNVLHLSKIARVREPLEVKELPLRQIVALLKEKLEHLFESSGATATYELPEEIADKTVKVDEDAMSQIAINLVDNAIKFSRGASPWEVHIGFRTMQSDSTTVFFVRDFGPGVPKGEQRKIFELFYRSGEELTRKTTGTGIGLALVRELAQQMRATVDYRSREPGAEFQVRFNCSF